LSEQAAIQTCGNLHKAAVNGSGIAKRARDMAPVSLRENGITEENQKGAKILDLCASWIGFSLRNLATSLV